MDPINTCGLVGKAAKKTTDAAKKVGSAGTTAVTAGTKAAMHTGAALFGAGKRATQNTGSLIQQLNRQLQWNPKHLHEGRDEGDPYNDELLKKKLAKAYQDGLLENREKELAMLRGASGMEVTKSCIAVDEGNAELAPPRTYHRLEVSPPVPRDRLAIYRHGLARNSKSYAPYILPTTD